MSTGQVRRGQVAGRSGRRRGCAGRSPPRRSAPRRGLGRRGPSRAPAPGRTPPPSAPAARSATKASGSRGVPVPSETWSIGTSRPVTPSSTTSGMPPVAVPTTAASQAIASRLTMPSGSYTDGQTNVVAAESTAQSSSRGSIRSIHTTPPRTPSAASTSPCHLGHDLRRVRRPGAEHELDLRGQPLRGAQQVRQPLLPGDPPDEHHRGPVRVDRPARGRRPRPPAGASPDRSMPLCTTTTRSGSTCGIATQDVRPHAGAHRDHAGAAQVRGLAPPTTTARSRRRAARPSTGAAAPGCAPRARAARRCSSPARCPARLAYQVWEWTTSAPAQSAAMVRSTPNVRSAAFAAASSGRSGYPVTPGSGRGAPNARTRTSARGRSTAARFST